MYTQMHAHTHESTRTQQKHICTHPCTCARTNQHARAQMHASICIMGIRGTLQLSVPASRNSFPPGTCLEGEQGLRGALLAVSPSCPLPALLPTGLAVPRCAASQTPGRRGETQHHSVPGPAPKGRRSAKRHYLTHPPKSASGVAGGRMCPSALLELEGWEVGSGHLFFPPLTLLLSRANGSSNMRSGASWPLTFSQQPSWHGVR